MSTSPATPKPNSTARSTPVSSPPVTRHTTADITAANDVINPASTRNDVTVVPFTSGSVTPVTVTGATKPSCRMPTRGITARASSLWLRDVIYERSLKLVDRFRVIRTIDIAA